MTEGELKALLKDIERARIAVIGDYCLDIYWFIDMSASETSIETGLKTHPVARQEYRLGGAGNVVNNLVALGCGTVKAFGVVGDDPWGKEILRLLGELGVDSRGMIRQDNRWNTLAYTKPHIDDVEQNRIDFGNYNRIFTDTASSLLNLLQQSLPELDVVIVNEQVLQGIHSQEIRQGLADLIRRNPETVFIADSRHYSECYTGACLKLNGHEAVRLCGMEKNWDEIVMRDEVVRAAHDLFERFGKPVFITRGNRGLVVRDQSGLSEIPGIQVLAKVDTVGAGDSTLAGIASALAVGYTPAQSAELGNFVATVTIQKLRQTGTASPEEVLAVGADPDYVYHPELAEDIRQAVYLDGSEFEIIGHIPEGIKLTHAIFDHDGTISTLREGWERIMEPMMVRAVLGPKFSTADESLYHKVVDRVRDYIDKSTGIQTLVQMQGLIEIVREFDCVPEDEILDEFGYKEIYNEALMKMVQVRVEKLKKGELGVEDFTIKNAPELLRRLHAAGVKLYLASGTDQQDVIDEAEALGYAHLFEGGIHGSVGDVTKEAKRIVLDRILNSIGPEAVSGLATFGDGPVEMRECHKRGGLAVGVASDEVRRYGHNESKRARLVRAGADIIVPDFSQLDSLLRILNVE